MEVKEEEQKIVIMKIFQRKLVVKYSYPYLTFVQLLMHFLLSF